ncbi:CarboxypepD_reg-like domain-containing protein [Chitinophaga sp. CF118]|uniref:carboxypeptidase-like regulatory domain-containing protein n=1 Tax=Chitinophaga sp. CF118 TaxID=1884367 RepID=UPI0008EF9007|nr:carboxypeptidase-like regulatory domain-containing protein [Chitinophaga sp. CF118]SFD27511.1 CarboxypepD_reg-like domain-containing protein [Chitinophaga sp. CF118]
MPRRIKRLSGSIGALCFYLFFCLQHVHAQVKVSGMVADGDNRTGLPGVTIINKSTRSGTITNESGRFSIDAMPGDSLEFSMLSYYGKILPVPATSMFINVYLSRRVFGLQQVNIRAKDYHQDSMSVRDEYRKYFNYHKPGALDVLKTLPSNPITALTYLVPSKARKRKEHFQEQLVYWEKEKFIDHRYNPELVERMTKLNGNDLDTFMHRYRPGYQFIMDATEYDLMLYIKQSFEQYKLEKTMPAKKEEEN